MEMTITTFPYTVVRPQGHLNAINAAAFGRRLNAEVAYEKATMLLVDLAQVESMDSAGLMVLVSALSLAQRQNKRFSLCSISPSMRIIFELTQLDRVFEMFENRAAFDATLHSLVMA